jgi:hypothetical protein
MRKASIALALILMVVAGCASGKVVAEYQRGKLPKMAEVRQPGTYALYRVADTKPMVRYRLRRGDPIGFRESGGRIVAVAGENEYPLSGRTIISNVQWKLVAE